MSKSYSISVLRAAVITIPLLPTGLAAAADLPGGDLEAGDEMVVTATRQPLPRLRSGAALSVIDADTIAARGSVLLSDLLRSVPGVAVNRGGPMGFLTQARMRGAEGNHTLVLIDGVEANDPASGSEFNFAHLVTADIERVEILRGAGSALWGSEAIGGVINIVTTDGDSGFGMSGRAEVGSFGSVYGQASLRGGDARMGGRAAASFLDSPGMNASRFGEERDGYENLTLSAKGRMRASKTLSLDAALRYVDTRSQFDTADFTFGSPSYGLLADTRGDRRDERQIYARTGASLSLLDDRWTHSASLSLSDNESDQYAAGAFSNRIEGRRWRAAYQTALDWTGGPMRHRITGAVEYERERFANRPADPMDFSAQQRHDDETSLVGEYHADWGDSLSITAGLRHDGHDTFADATTYRLAGSLTLVPGKTRLHASTGTGVANPGFLELYGYFPNLFTGNPDLQPEKSTSYDIGVEHYVLDGRGRIDVTYFRADLEREIITLFDFETFTSTTANLEGQSKRNGLEAEVDLNLTDRLGLRASYSHIRSKDPDGNWELRRPKHLASLSLDIASPDERLRVNLAADYTGKQRDTDFSTGQPVILDDFLLVNANLRYGLTQRVDITGRIENLLDDRYEEQFSYRSPGIRGYVGVSARL